MIRINTEETVKHAYPKPKAKVNPTQQPMHNETSERKGANEMLNERCESRMVIGQSTARRVPRRRLDASTVSGQ